MRKNLIILSGLILGLAASAVVGCAARERGRVGGGATPGGATSQKETSPFPDGPGRKVLDTACTTCHNLDEVIKFKGYYAKENWRDIVTTMIADGARVDEAQIPVLVDYLAKSLPREFPDGPEKKLLDTACSGCHPVTDIRKMDGYLTRDDWQDLIRVMAAKGAKISEGQVKPLADYLSSTFPPRKRVTASTSR